MQEMVSLSDILKELKEIKRNSDFIPLEELDKALEE